MKNFNYLMDHILYHIFKIILNKFKKLEMLTDNPSISIYLNKIENRVTFKYRKLSWIFQCLKQWNYLRALKVRQLMIKMVKMCTLKKLLN